MIFPMSGHRMCHQNVVCFLIEPWPPGIPCWFDYGVKSAADCRLAHVDNVGQVSNIRAIVYHILLENRPGEDLAEMSQLCCRFCIIVLFNSFVLHCELM